MRKTLDNIYLSLMVIHIILVPIGLIGMFIADYLQVYGMCQYGAVAPNGGVYMGDWCEPRWMATIGFLSIPLAMFWSSIWMNGAKKTFEYIFIFLFVSLLVLSIGLAGASK
jgi:hypothetical protein